MNSPTNKEIDDLYDTLDVLMYKGKWDLLNSIFILWTDHAWRTDVDRLLTYATASLPAKTHILSRPAFIARCKQLYPDPELWKGLE